MSDTRSLTVPIADAYPGNAPAPLNGRFGNLAGIWLQPAVQRAMPALSIVAALALAGGAYVAFSAPAQTPLFAGLAEADKAAVSEALQSAGIDYAIDPQSGTITVAGDQVHQARIALAGQGLPKAQPTGNTLMAELPMGASRAVEGETLRAVRETELARTIEAIDAVQTAKVHIGTPEPSPFVQENRPATASVMLTLEGGRSLSDGQVQAIRFLVASSVPGLDAAQVSVIDQRGALLSEMAGDADLAMFQLQARVEDRLRASIDRLIAPMLGQGNYSVEVRADVDMTESQATRESFPESDRALRSEQMERSTSGQQGSAAVGIPGATSNIPPAPAVVTNTPPAPVAAAVPTGGATQTNENMARSYEIGREISVTHQPQGSLRRVSVAVALNQGKKAFTQADLAKFEGLVKGAVGFNAERGDQVAISQRPFAKADQAELAFWEQPWFLPLAQQVGGLLAALLAFLLIGRPLIRSAKARAAARAEREEALATELLAITGDGAARTRPAAYGPITIDMIEAAPSYQARANLVRDFVRQDPARATLVIRQLMQERGNG
ncbi:MAG TPA: flagellar M-ring protein FliF [Xanthomonadales bacterium]|nr:flagellar M-ring protein FliF [Xanthomonadales bacterium]